MKILLRLSIALFLSSLIGSTTFAQDQQKAVAAAPLVTATAKGRQVRFAALGEVREVRVEVFDAQGQKVYDSSFRAGNLFDYQLQDQQGQHLADGSYLYLVTTRDLSERLSQKYGNILLQGQQVSFEHVGRKHLPEAQSQALESSRQSGAQSPVDRVGVEVPSAENNEANSASGTARNGGGNAASPTIVKSTAITPAVAGTGTPNRITKWMDNTGTLGDSSITEANGNVGIGTTAPRTTALAEPSCGATARLRPARTLSRTLRTTSSRRVRRAASAFARRPKWTSCA